MPLFNIRKIRPNLRSAQSIKAVVATRRAQSHPLPPSVHLSACGLPYYLDRKGIPLRYIKGYYGNA